MCLTALDFVFTLLLFLQNLFILCGGLRSWLGNCVSLYIRSGSSLLSSRKYFQFFILLQYTSFLTPSQSHKWGPDFLLILFPIIRTFLHVPYCLSDLHYPYDYTIVSCLPLFYFLLVSWMVELVIPDKFHMWTGSNWSRRKFSSPSWKHRSRGSSWR